MSNENINWLNNAQVEELKQVKGLDARKAEEIVNFREKNGEFRNWEDLQKIQGFNNEMIDSLKNHAEEGSEKDDEE